MQVDKGSFSLGGKKKLLLSKKELHLLQQGSPKYLKSHEPDQLGKYVKLARALRDKYRDLAQRQKADKKDNDNSRTIEKAKIFDRLLSSYRRRLDTKNASEQVRQSDLDHAEHYNLDGITQVHGKTVASQVASMSTKGKVRK